MPRAKRVKRLWAEFVGPESTPTNGVLAAATTVLGAVAAPSVVRGRQGSMADAVVAALLATDLAGGVYVNNTRACARWYKRSGQGDVDHLKFAVAHVHPGAIAWLDRRANRRLPAWAWATAHYTYMIGATAAIGRAGTHRRPVGFGLTVGGLMLDRMLGPSFMAPWFAWTYYPKLLMGHAAASLWSDSDLGVDRRVVHMDATADVPPENAE